MKITIVIEDIDNDEINMNIEFDPPVSGETKTTTAAAIALTMLDAAIDALHLWLRWLKRHAPTDVGVAIAEPALTDAEIDQIRGGRAK